LGTALLAPDALLLRIQLAAFFGCYFPRPDALVDAGTLFGLSGILAPNRANVLSF